MQHLLLGAGHAVLGALVLLTSLAAAPARADATSYFPSLTSSEVEWVDSHLSKYRRHAFMPSAADPEDGAAVFWNVDGDSIDFAVAVRAEGWVGFGISEAGGMIGSDVALFSASDPSQLVDSHVIEDRSYPLRDDCQDWKLVGNPTVQNGWMIVEMRRLLDTKDPQDHAIKNDADPWAPPTRIVAAWGDDGNVSYHGGKKARNSVRLFADHSNDLTEMQVLSKALEEGSDGHFDFLQDEYEIPAEETTYHEVCMTIDDLNIDLPEGQDMLTMIGAVPIITEETREFVHHFTVYVQADCSNTNNMKRSMLYAWAPGDEGWALPEDVGFPVFDGVNNQALHIQIHYDNPTFKTGMKDSSGLRFYYILSDREHRAGILELGDPWINLGGQQIDDGHTKYEFTCPGKCSSTFLAQTERSGESHGVTILSEYLHMHQTGVRMTHEVIRDGEVYHTAVADVFDFNQQGVHHVPQDSLYKVLPGDSFRTTCYYKDGSSFGLSSQEEMCIAFIMYYPAKQYFGNPWICPHMRRDYFGIGCNQELVHSTLDSVEELERNFGDSSGECSTELATYSPPTIVSTTTQAAPNAGEPAAAPSSNNEPETSITVPQGATPVDAPTIVQPAPAPDDTSQTITIPIGGAAAKPEEPASCARVGVFIAPLAFTLPAISLLL